jgi:hypothetical protein
MKEMCAVADLDCTAEERDHCKEAIRALSTMLKRNRAKGAPSGSMVSSSLKTNKGKTTLFIFSSWKTIEGGAIIFITLIFIR